MNFRNPHHLAFVRSFQCCVCGNPHSIAHHLRIDSGMGMKSSDFWSVPLCIPCHTHGPDAVHTVGSKLELDWFFVRGVDAKQIAINLFEQSPHKDHIKPKPVRQKVTSKSRWLCGKDSKHKQKVGGKVVKR